MVIMVRAGGLRGFTELMSSLGVEPESLLRQFHLDPERLKDEDELIPLQQAVNVLEYSAEKTGQFDIGLQLAEMQGIDILGPVAVAMQNCPTVAEALDCLSRFLHVHSPGLVFRYAGPSCMGPDTTDFHYETNLDAYPPPRQIYELGLGVAHRVLKVLAGPNYKLVAVCFPHKIMAKKSVYQRFFGSPVLQEQSHSALCIANSTLQAPLKSANADLHKIAANYLQTNFSDPALNLSGRVRLAITKSLGTEISRKTTIAEMFNMHPRTLQRRLELEGTTYNEILDDVRRKETLRYLTNTQLPFSQIAGLLGFSEQSVLTRYCRHSFQATPSRIRKGF